MQMLRIADAQHLCCRPAGQDGKLEKLNADNFPSVLVVMICEMSNTGHPAPRVIPFVGEPRINAPHDAGSPRLDFCQRDKYNDIHHITFSQVHTVDSEKMKAQRLIGSKELNGRKSCMATPG